jgi:hypothetical protein
VARDTVDEVLRRLHAGARHEQFELQVRDRLGRVVLDAVTDEHRVRLTDVLDEPVDPRLLGRGTLRGESRAGGEKEKPSRGERQPDPAAEAPGFGRGRHQ